MIAKNLGAIKPKGINRIAKIWEQYCLCPLVYCSQILAILFMPFGLLLPDFSYPVYALWFYCSRVHNALLKLPSSGMLTIEMLERQTI
jgi:hypothetical protein